MNRRWGVAASLLALFVVVLFQLIASTIAIHVSVAFVRAATNPLVRVWSFFMPLTRGDIEMAPLRPWWLGLRLSVVVLIVVFVYVSVGGHPVETGIARSIPLSLGAVMLAAGVGDVAGLAIAVFGGTSVAGEDHSVGAGATIDSWTSDADFSGFWLAVLIGLMVCLLEILRMMWKVFQDSTRGPSERPELVRDVPGRSSHLALLGVLPVTALAFVGGAGRFLHAGEEGPATASQMLGDAILYPRLRPKPPPAPNAGPLVRGPREMIYGHMDESWLAATIAAVVLLALLWLLLRFVVGGLRLPDSAGPGFVILAGWAVTVVAGVLTAFVHAAIHWTQGWRFGDTFVITLPMGMRFGVTWGWLVGLLVMVGHRRTSMPEPPAFEEVKDSALQDG